MKEQGTKAPIAEVVSIGTELLLGQILDAHAQTMARVLAECGIACHYRQTVGDNLARAAEAIRMALARSDVVITIGGLGPTEDDLTRQAIAEALGERLVRSPEMERALREMTARRKMPFLDSLLNQADRPESGRFIDNHNGSAPGLLCEKRGKTVIALPGPPGEFNPMAKGPVRDYLSKLSGDHVIFSRILRVCGIGESWVEDKIRDWMASPNPTVAPYAKTGEVHLRLTARARSRQEAEALVKPVEDRIRAVLGQAVYGIDDTSLEEAVLNLLRERKMRVAVAESITAGLVGARLTAVPGASSVFLGGILAYDPTMKAKLLHVPTDLLSRFGPVSAECASAMAEGVRLATGAEFGIATTGNAGPTSDVDSKPVGLVYIAVAEPTATRVQEQSFRGSRSAIRDRCAQEALILLRDALLS